MTQDHKIHDQLPSGFFYADALQAEEFAATGSINGAAKILLVRTAPVTEATLRREADALQSVGPDEFPRGYYEHLAAERLAESPDTDVAVRLRPPRSWADVDRPLITAQYGAEKLLTRAQRDAALAWYIAQYNAGYAAARRGSDSCAAWDSGRTSRAWDDGYLDGAAGRAKWHLTYCTDHDTCGEG